MNNSSQYHAYIDDLLLQSCRGDLFFDENILVKPVILSDVEIAARTDRHAIIGEFFSRARAIFHRCLCANERPALKTLLVNDSANRIPEAFYRGLPQALWTNPVFFRTDEARNGKIFEIQCPGSGWGDLFLLSSLYKTYSADSRVNTFDPQSQIVTAIQAVCDASEPAVLHLLDNSSNPSSMKYLIHCTRPPLRYWSYDKDVRSGECVFVRSHSVYGLLAENLFTYRVELAAQGKLIFDLPPLLLFDQKMMLCLPFLEETKDEFSSEIRNILTYTYPLKPEGFRDHNGEWVTIEAFLHRPGRLRKYFLKYGGCDTTINWGSRAVFRLDTNNAGAQLQRAASDFTNGRPWVIQPEISSKESIVYVSRDSYEPKTETLRAKYSTFYGPNGLLGIRAHHRRDTKVHGHADAVVGLAL